MGKCDVECDADQSTQVVVKKWKMKLVQVPRPICRLHAQKVKKNDIVDFMAGRDATLQWDILYS